MGINSIILNTLVNKDAGQRALKKIRTLEKKQSGTKSLYVENKIRVRYDHECTPSYLLLMQNPYVSLHKFANE